MDVLLVGVYIAPNSNISSVSNKILSDATTVTDLGIIHLTAHSCSVKDNVEDSVVEANDAVVEVIIIISEWQHFMWTQLKILKWLMPLSTCSLTLPLAKIRETECASSELLAEQGAHILEGKAKYPHRKGTSRSCEE